MEARIAQELMVAQARAAGGVTEFEEVEIMYQVGHAVGRKRGPHRVTDEFLTTVLGQEREGGVKLVMKSHEVSERTARRWLRQAAERGLR